MNTSKYFPCLVCGKKILTHGVTNNYDIDTVGMTHGSALLCRTTGNYGSAIFDPEDSSFIDFVVCDDCMLDNRDKVRVVTPNRRPKPRGKVDKDYLDVTRHRLLDEELPPDTL